MDAHKALRVVSHVASNKNENPSPLCKARLTSCHRARGYETLSEFSIQGLRILSQKQPGLQHTLESRRSGTLKRRGERPLT